MAAVLHTLSLLYIFANSNSSIDILVGHAVLPKVYSARL